MNDMPNSFTDIQIIESLFLTRSVEHIVPRTWRERLLTRPWQPFTKTKSVWIQEPSPHCVRLNSNTIVMHPAFAGEIRKSLRYEDVR